MKIRNGDFCFFTGEIMGEEVKDEKIKEIGIVYDVVKVPNGKILGIFNRYKTIQTKTLVVYVRTRLKYANPFKLRLIAKRYTNYSEAVSMYNYIINHVVSSTIPKEKKVRPNLALLK